MKSALRSFRSHWLRSRALMKAKFTRDGDAQEGIPVPSTDGLLPPARDKLKAMADVMACSQAEASFRILERALAGLPNRALPAYLLPHLAIKRCERIGEELIRIELAGGRVFTGHRSNQKEFILHQVLSQHLPAAIDGNAYKLALDIERRYYGVNLPWYVPRHGIYVEGGCFTGIKAIRWADLADKPVKIVAVEIGASNFEILRTNIAGNGLSDVIVPVHAGLWRESKQGIQRHDFSTRRFLEVTDEWEEQMRHEERVELITLDELLDRQSVEVADYVNIQVNGAEIEVLKGIRNWGRIKVLGVAAYFSKDGVHNADVVERILTDAGCTVIDRTNIGRVTAVTPNFLNEISSLKEGREHGRRARRGHHRS